MRLAAYDMPRLTALHAAVEAGNLPAVRALVAAAPNLGTEAERRRAAARLAKLRETDAPDIMLRAEAYAADPRQSTLDALDRGERPGVLGFAEVASLVIVSPDDLEWVLDVDAHDAAGPRRFGSVAYRSLWGSTRLEIDGRRLFPHWRTQLGWSQELLDETNASIGPSWDLNWHDDAGVVVARDYFATAKQRTPPEAARGRSLDEVRSRESMGFTVQDWELPWAAAAVLTRASKQMDRLAAFYAKCAKRGWQVGSSPTDL